MRPNIINVDKSEKWRKTAPWRPALMVLTRGLVSHGLVDFGTWGSFLQLKRAP